MRRLSALCAPLVLLPLILACKDSSLATLAFNPTKGSVVLNGFGSQGVTLVPDTGAVTSSIAFGASFDGGSMRVERDTVLTTSSKAGGDLLYVSSLASGTVKTIQMPSGSNPGTATMSTGFTQGSIVVALRDSQAIAFVSNVGGATPIVSLVRGIGTCPGDVLVYEGAVWVLDANQNCRTTYASLGPSRLLRVSLAGLTIAAIDTFHRVFNSPSRSKLRLASSPTICLAGIKNSEANSSASFSEVGVAISCITAWANSCAVVNLMRSPGRAPLIMIATKCPSSTHSDAASNARCGSSIVVTTQPADSMTPNRLSIGPSGTPTAEFDFDAIGGFTGGVFVG